MTAEKNILDEEKTISFLENILQIVKTEADPQVLNEYRRLFRKTVPLTMRSYVAGYLIKENVDPSFGRNKGSKGQRGRFFSQEKPAQTERPVLSPDVSTSIFISIGKSRRVYPRDIITLLIQQGGVQREHIGDIRILENYSFVQVLTEEADGIIDKLHNSSYRGRNITVSYSRKQEEPAEVSEAQG
ncbi:RNA-binding protein [Treponema phagedenis]|uniref:RNA-binding protein n=1 Tax=Treponema phagedenis TaxID=162 RepID=A0A0B7GU21_TREPH|nr:DbpA RNA binding domain-containing protein [Treponema phagedenis]NVP23751.1 DbpA RNA binding domain-containing protein [Treponema phagedenis]QEJ97493.1 RNA-binding protein [Treponema phagedenis]QEK01690.1 RNA-binding protein [Treponema phagedenis]QEK03063.1 RNA-binding protein [Treponema phagedenis]QEK06807.1 RNA-binding protein [Treponema phagedenis]